MIACDIGVEFSPQPLDAIVLRRVGRQKMQHDPTAELLGQRPLHQLAGVDAVVVEDHMKFPRSGKGLAQAAQEQKEQVAVLPGVADPEDLPRAGVQRPGQIVFLVLARPSLPIWMRQ